MDDIGTSNDDSSGGLSFRRPSRAERAIDDPIREMEGMLVDEYGRLATYFHPCSCEILLSMNLISVAMKLSFRFHGRLRYTAPLFYCLFRKKESTVTSYAVIGGAVIHDLNSV